MLGLLCEGFCAVLCETLKTKFDRVLQASQIQDTVVEVKLAKLVKNKRLVFKSSIHLLLLLLYFYCCRKTETVVFHQ